MGKIMPQTGAVAAQGRVRQAQAPSLLATAMGLAMLLMCGCFMPGEYTIRVHYADNFRMVKPDVVGSSSGFSLFGLVPIVQPTWTGALSDMHRQARLEAGSRQVLANEEREQTTTYLVLFSLPRKMIRADVIEVLDEAAPHPEQAGEPLLEARIQVGASEPTSTATDHGPAEETSAARPK